MTCAILGPMKKLVAARLLEDQGSFFASPSYKAATCRWALERLENAYCLDYTGYLARRVFNAMTENSVESFLTAWRSLRHLANLKVYTYIFIRRHVLYAIGRQDLLRTLEAAEVLSE